MRKGEIMREGVIECIKGRSYPVIPFFVPGFLSLIPDSSALMGRSGRGNYAGEGLRAAVSGQKLLFRRCKSE